MFLCLALYREDLIDSRPGSCASTSTELFSLVRSTNCMIIIEHISGGALLPGSLPHFCDDKLSGGLSWIGWVVMLLPYNPTPSL